MKCWSLDHLHLFCLIDQIDENLKTALQADLNKMAPGLMISVSIYEVLIDVEILGLFEDDFGDQMRQCIQECIK